MKNILFILLSMFSYSTNSFAQNNSQTAYEKDLNMSFIFIEKTKERAAYSKIRLYLNNESTDKEYLIIKPSDGSESAWREPYIYFKIELKKDKEWLPLKAGLTLRCGLFDADWQKDVFRLQANQKEQIYEMAFANILAGFEIPSNGIIRIQAYYDYKQGQHPKDHKHVIPEAYTATLEQEIPQSIKTIPPFVLESNSIEIEIKNKAYFLVK